MSGKQGPVLIIEPCGCMVDHGNVTRCSYHLKEKNSMTIPHGTNKKQYVGDGVYVDHDGFGYIVTTEDGYTNTNRIVFEPEIWDSLVKCIAEIDAILEAEIEARQKELLHCEHKPEEKE